MKHLIQLTVNGESVEAAVNPNQTLAHFIRNDLGMTGTKIGCSIGDCGACTVLLDGIPVFSCLVLAIEAEGRTVETIEGVADGDTLHPLQTAFIEKGAIQCGFCTPGMVLNSLALLRHTPMPTEEQIRRALSGNLCRCTGYQKIIEAVQEAAVVMQSQEAAR